MKNIFSLLLVIWMCSTLGCMIDHKRESYSKVPEQPASGVTIIDEGFTVQLFGQDHSDPGGLTLDIKGPYKIHTRLWTETAFTAYTLDAVVVTRDGHEIDLLEDKDPVRVVAEQNPHGLFMAQYDFEDAFDGPPANDQSALTVTISGTVSFGDTEEEFHVVRRYKLEKEEIRRRLTFEDILQL